jgi:hypothetical protein
MNLIEYLCHDRVLSVTIKANSESEMHSVDSRSKLQKLLPR